MRNVFLRVKYMSNNPPKSKFSRNSDKTFSREIWTRVLLFFGIWLAAASLILSPLDQLGISKDLATKVDQAILILTIFMSLISDQILNSINGKRSRDEISESHDLIISAIEGSNQI